MSLFYYGKRRHQEQLLNHTTSLPVVSVTFVRGLQHSEKLPSFLFFDRSDHVIRAPQILDFNTFVQMAVENVPNYKWKQKWAGHWTQETSAF